MNNKLYSAKDIEDLWYSIKLNNEYSHIKEFVKKNFNRVGIVERPMKQSRSLFELKKSSSL